MFSTSRESTPGKCNRLTDYNLERKVLLRKKKHTCDTNNIHKALINFAINYV